MKVVRKTSVNQHQLLELASEGDGPALAQLASRCGLGLKLDLLLKCLVVAGHVGGDWFLKAPLVRMFCMLRA